MNVVEVAIGISYDCKNQIRFFKAGVKYIGCCIPNDMKALKFRTLQKRCFLKISEAAK